LVKRLHLDVAPQGIAVHSAAILEATATFLIFGFFGFGLLNYADETVLANLALGTGVFGECFLALLALAFADHGHWHRAII
jgi:hypothetical protein